MNRKRPNIQWHVLGLPATSLLGRSPTFLRPTESPSSGSLWWERMAGHPSTHAPSYEGLGSPRNILGNQQFVLQQKSRVPDIIQFQIENLMIQKFIFHIRMTIIVAWTVTSLVSQLFRFILDLTITFHGVNYFFLEEALHQHLHRREDVSLFCCYVTSRMVDAWSLNTQ